MNQMEVMEWESLESTNPSILSADLQKAKSLLTSCRICRSPLYRDGYFQGYSLKEEFALLSALGKSYFLSTIHDLASLKAS